ncbi:MAG: CBS domain-containing protein [Candidatus Thiodiazotropha sp. (ex Cardiolucina cf. quadrata)]|nr:CBS domain-containing protein [Candidatus Thiodiazotropha sp. (ex Cardiolucina cf. quadrata)]
MSNEDRSSSGSSRNWLERISRLFSSEPQDKEEIYDLLKEANERDLLDHDALVMMEGAMLVSERRTRDIMTPRSKLDVVRSSDSMDEILRMAIESAHSRLPVIGEDIDEILGLLLSKDLLPFFQYHHQVVFDVQKVMREVLFVPGTMRLNQLLKQLKLIAIIWRSWLTNMALPLVLSRLRICLSKLSARSRMSTIRLMMIGGRMGSTEVIST